MQEGTAQCDTTSLANGSTPISSLLSLLSVNTLLSIVHKTPARGNSLRLKCSNLASPLGTQHAMRFAQEVDIAISLCHPHILPVSDHGEDRTFRYFVMELMEHGTLNHLLHRRLASGIPFSVPFVLALGIQLCDALHYAHCCNVIHRDVKPANILLGNDDALDLQLGDFGIALFLQRLERLTGTGRTVGTPEYMSPEQFQGREIDGRTDDYAIASVLYELLSLRPPFIGNSTIAIGIAKLRLQPVPLNRLNPLVPPIVVKVIHQALQRFPYQRYHSSEVFAKAMASCLEQVDEKIAHVYKEGATIWNLPMLVLNNLAPPVGATAYPGLNPNNLNHLCPTCQGRGTIDAPEMASTRDAETPRRPTSPHPTRWFLTLLAAVLLVVLLLGFGRWVILNVIINSNNSSIFDHE